MSKSNKFKLSTIVCILILLAVFAYNIYSAIHLNKVCTEETEATVTAIKTKRVREDKKNKKYYYPTLSYEVDGKEYSRKGERTRSRSEYAIGEKIKIMYNPANPKEFYVKGMIVSNPIIKMVVDLALPVIIGLVCTVIYIIVIRKKKEKRAN